MRWCTNASDFSLYLKDWEYGRRTCSSGVEGALVAWLCRRAEFLMNWERGILQLSADAGVPAGLLQTTKTERTMWDTRAIHSTGGSPCAGPHKRWASGRSAALHMYFTIKMSDKLFSVRTMRNLNVLFEQLFKPFKQTEWRSFVWILKLNFSSMIFFSLSYHHPVVCCIRWVVITLLTWTCCCKQIEV